MLNEVTITRQVPGEPHRRWFTDDHMDLIVWDTDGDRIGFQLCYQSHGTEHALTWMRDSGFSHDGVDDGESGVFAYKMTPVLVPDGRFDVDRVLADFQTHCTAIEPEIAAWVSTILRTYPHVP